MPRQESKVGYSNQLVLGIIARTSKIPPPYKTFLLVQAYAETPITRANLAEATPDDVEVDVDDGVVYVLGSRIAPYGAQALLEYMGGWLARADSDWLFPAPRSLDKPVSCQMASRYIGKVYKGTIKGDE